jgi:hypothetical protein
VIQGKLSGDGVRLDSQQPRAAEVALPSSEGWRAAPGWVVANPQPPKGLTALTAPERGLTILLVLLTSMNGSLPTVVSLPAQFAETSQPQASVKHAIHE